MTDVEFDTFSHELARCAFTPTEASRLVIAPVPKPFVSPRLQRASSDGTLLADVIFVRASAAVGKSTVAKSLSSQKNIPLLDLSKVSIGAGGLSGLLDTLTGLGNPRDAFHAGELPIIIDALDEGRLTNPAKSFEEFFEDTARFLHSGAQASNSNRPKIICFGRFEAVDLVQTIIEATESEISVKVLDIGFFDRVAAFSLLQRYADLNAKDGSAWRNEVRDHQTIVDLFFTSIAAALGIASEELWASENGKAFAGYAPVLQAVGILLSKVGPTFDALRSRLSQSGSVDAWDVIENVVGFIFEREQQEKVVDPLTAAFRNDGLLAKTSELPSVLFDRVDQTWLILQLIDGCDLEDLTTVVTESQVAGAFLAPWDVARTRYLQLIRTFIREHPFYVAAQASFSNDVVGSICIADAVVHDWTLRKRVQNILDSLSRFPFVWRSVKARLPEEIALKSHIGACILNSYWNDPLTRPYENGLVTIASEAEVAAVRLPSTRTEATKISIGKPLSFFGQVANCDVQLENETIVLEGYRGAGERSSLASQTVFFLRGDVKLISRDLVVKADEITLEGGEIWLEAQEFVQSGQAHLTIRQGTDYGWSEHLAHTYPWSREAPNISRPSTESTALSRFFGKCAEKLVDAPAVVLFADYSVPFNDPSMSWARNFGQQWQDLVATLIAKGLATSKHIGARGSAQKLQVSFTADWRRLTGAARSVEDNVSRQAIQRVVDLAVDEK